MAECIHSCSFPSSSITTQFITLHVKATVNACLVSQQRDRMHDIMHPLGALKTSVNTCLVSQYKQNASGRQFKATVKTCLVSQHKNRMHLSGTLRPLSTHA